MKVFVLFSAITAVVLCRSTSTDRQGSQGLVMAGGAVYNPPNPTIYQTSVEMFFPSTDQHCQLPPLPLGRAGLTLDLVEDVLVACGGDPALTSCMKLVDGSWNEFYVTMEIRRGFTSWVSSKGLLLLGSFVAPPTTCSDTTELVPLKIGDQEGYSWKLGHDSARFCTIPVEEELIMTGGVKYFNKVVKYSMAGEATDLPDMIHGRMGHACSWYEVGEQQMLIVAGGSDSTNAVISSTEVFLMGGTGWRKVGDLMRPMGGLKNAKLGNNVYLSGGWSGGLDAGSYHDEIVVFNKEKEEWEEVAKMAETRINHGMTVASSDFCVA